MKYTLHQLKIFSVIAEVKSITKASEILHMTQPAASIQLKNFQNQFDIPLTEVIGRQIYVTDFGKRVKEIADKVLEETDKLQYEMNLHMGILSGKLKISSSSTGKYVIPHFLSPFMLEHEGIDLQLDVKNKQLVVESLVKNEIDFAFISTVPKDIPVEEELLIENKLYLLSSPLSTHQRLIVREKGSATRDAMLGYFKDNLKDAYRMELTSNEAVKQAVIAGLGDSILPLIGVENELNNKELEIINRPELPIVFYWRLVWLKGKELSPVAQRFLDFIRTKKDTIIKDKFAWYKAYD